MMYFVNLFNYIKGITVLYRGLADICKEDITMSKEFISIKRIDDLFMENYNQNTNRKESNKKENMLEEGIEELDLEVRSYNCLKRAGIHTIGDLVNKTEKEIIKVKYLEKRSLEEIQYQLAKLNLTLRSSDGE